MPFGLEMDLVREEGARVVVLSLLVELCELDRALPPPVEEELERKVRRSGMFEPGPRNVNTDRSIEKMIDGGWQELE